MVSCEFRWFPVTRGTLRVDRIGRFKPGIEWREEGWAAWHRSEGKQCFAEVFISAHIREDKVPRVLANLWQEWARPGSHVCQIDEFDPGRPRCPALG